MMRRWYRWLSRLPPDSERGTVTAEFAMVLPSVIVLTAVMLAMTRAAIVTLDCEQAAAAAARELLVSNDESKASSVVVHMAGDGASMTVSVEGSICRVVVECPVLPGPINVTPVQVSGDASVPRVGR